MQYWLADGDVKDTVFQGVVHFLQTMHDQLVQVVQLNPWGCGSDENMTFILSQQSLRPAMLRHRLTVAWSRFDCFVMSMVLLHSLLTGALPDAHGMARKTRWVGIMYEYNEAHTHTHIYIYIHILYDVHMKSDVEGIL